MSNPSSSLPAKPAGDLLSQINAQLAKAKQEGAHVLAPVTLQTIPAMHRPVVVAVQIDPDPKKKEVYPQKGGGFSLTALGWKKLGDAIGIQWSPKDCRRLDDGSDPNRCHYQMVGRVKALDGTWRTIMGDKEIRIETVIEELYDNYRERAQKLLADPQEAPKFRAAFPDPEAWVAEKVRQDALQIKKHLLARAQTGAMARATKSLGIRETYTAEELRKPFVFPKLVPELDPRNPEDRAFLRAQAAGAIDQLYQPSQRATAPEPALTPLPESSTDVVLHDMPTLDAVFNPEPARPAMPSPVESARLDFGHQDPEGQARTLQDLVKQKGYAGRIQGDMAKWTAQQRASFFERLMAMADKPKPAGAPDDLPFE